MIRRELFSNPFGYFFVLREQPVGGRGKGEGTQGGMTPHIFLKRSRRNR